MEKQKLCPFMKVTEAVYYTDKIVTYSAESFQPCIGEECVAYYEDGSVIKCMLCDSIMERKFHGSCI